MIVNANLPVVDPSRRPLRVLILLFWHLHFIWMSLHFLNSSLFFQDALLLQVSTVYVKAERKGEQVLKTVLSGLFKFQLDVFELIEEVCAIPDMTSVPKVATKALIVPFVILLFFTMYIFELVCSVNKAQNVRSESRIHPDFPHNKRPKILLNKTLKWIYISIVIYLPKRWALLSLYF